MKFIRQFELFAKHLLFALMAILVLRAPSARAEVVVLDKDDWKVGLIGFVEFDAITDTTSSFSEVAGSGPVKATGYDSNVGRTQFSMRNSRLAFNVVAPETDGYKSRGYFEMDFLGFDPQPTDAFAGGAANSEAGYYTNPTMRIRHAYLSTTSGSSQILVGQTWSLFGWQPTYNLTTVSLAPVAGMLYERTPQVMYTYTTNSGENQLVAAASLSRPNQRSAVIPNVEAGLKWASGGRKSGFAGANSDIKNQPMSVGLSGAMRTYAYPTSSSDAVQLTRTGVAGALDLMVPIIASEGDSVAGSLTLTAEATQGSGYGDEFANWAGTPALAVSTTAASPNLDKGLGGMDGSGVFRLLNLTSYNVQLQYHFSKGYLDVGYGVLHSDNVADLTSSATAAVQAAAYDNSETTFINYFHNCTKQIRIGAEYAQFRTRYNNQGVTTNATNTREMLATYYRF